MTKIKNPAYATFMNEVEDYISILSKDDLVKIILNFAESQNSKDRNTFLSLLKNKSIMSSQLSEPTSAIDLTSEQLLEAIQEYEKRIQNGVAPCKSMRWGLYKGA